MWYCKTPFGTFQIVPHRVQWQLKIDDTVLGTYPTPKAAADGVIDHKTGCDEWDVLGEDATGVLDLSEWGKEMDS